MAAVDMGYPVLPQNLLHLFNPSYIQTSTHLNLPVEFEKNHLTFL
jgi:hypothetical protein